ncbi:MAG: hypothetical protein A3F72_01870 [Bacteroidetes bacterium RIFCSPLOWO2_12_FULL_35_15]|nr:MAG: hypothetical protein A3F72_01870 [Bacteroidetes bacterium RIFCSPLOWO2_12_FULL_35_15]
MKKNNYILLFLLVIIISLLGYIALSHNKKSTVAYVEMETLYNDFVMKKELESKLTNVQQMRKHILDSIKIEANSLSLAVKSEKDLEGLRKFEIKKQEYLMKQKSFEEDNQLLTQNYDGQIWKQINQYVKDYGKGKEYELIIGSAGNGSVMYSLDKLNITKEVLEYINSSYRGEKK